MEEKILKINLELHIVGDGRTFLNYWNSRNGDDVIGELHGDHLLIRDAEDRRAIGLDEFIEKVKSKIES